MDLRLLFKPLHFFSEQENLAKKIEDAIYINSDEMPDWKNAKIALFSVANENEDFATPIREEFYKLYSGYSNNFIVDLGILKAGVTKEETISRIKEVCLGLFEQNIIPLVLGENHSLDYGIYQAYEGEFTNVLCIDARIDLLESTLDDENHIKQLILHEPNYLFNYAHLGYQSYLNPPEVFEMLEKLNFDKLRLGEISNNIKQTEPIIRFADMISFDLSAIKHVDLKAKKDSFPFGISAEQACQMAWYTGISNNCSSFGIFSYDNLLDERSQSAKVVATMLWYFIEGVYEREDKQPFDSDFFKKYIITGTDIGEIIFYKSSLKEFWWIKVEDNILPCGYSDYLSASEGFIPEIYDAYLMKFGE